MTELIWDGKYDKATGKKIAPPRIALPFQTVETINESAADRNRNLSLFGGGQSSEWRNRLIWGDKKYVLPSLLPELAGKVNLIYIDPPFATGADFSFVAAIPDAPNTSGTGGVFTKQPSVLEQKAYRDTWGKGLDSYLQWTYNTVSLLRELLSEEGSLYVHVGPNVSHYVKAVVDEVMTPDMFRSEIVWRRSNSHNKLTDQYGPIHDVILFYTKSDKFDFHPGSSPFSKGYIESRFKYKDHRGIYQPNYLTGPGTRTGDSGQEWHGYNPTKAGRHWAIPSRLVELLNCPITGKKTLEVLDLLLDADLLMIPNKAGGQPMYKQYLTEGVPYQDIWSYQPNTQGVLYNTEKAIDADVKWLEQEPETVGYNTQKPEGLLERIIKSSSSPGDLVLDCFCGSGTTATVAEKLGRRWITCDLGRFAIHTARKRFLAIENVKPFVVQNLGKYERQAWQTAEFGADAEAITQSYRDFILSLYRAQPISGYVWLHGVKNGRMVHIGGVDAPISVGDVAQVAAEFKRSRGTGDNAPSQNSVDILGWDFAFELNEVSKQQAAQAGVDVRFIRIPREVLEKKAVEQGDIKFFELAALSVNILQSGKGITLTLKDFVIPLDDVPQEVQSAITHWEQWIDYWAVDWDNKGDTFHNQWQAYRTRKDKTLQKQIASPPGTYKEPGEYKVVVKVIDILGNDTTKTVKVNII